MSAGQSDLTAYGITVMQCSVGAIQQVTVKLKDVAFQDFDAKMGPVIPFPLWICSCVCIHG